MAKQWSENPRGWCGKERENYTVNSFSMVWKNINRLAS